MLLSSPATSRSLLETQIKLVHDVTNKPLNEIKMDLEYTRDPQLTIDRVYGGEFLKGTPRDPSFKAQSKNKNLIRPKDPPLSRSGEGGVNEKQGKDMAKTGPQEYEVIDLCDSGDEIPVARGPKKPSAFQSAKVPRAATKSNQAGSSNTDSLLSIVKPYTNITTLPERPLPPSLSSQPLFRYPPSSSSLSPSPAPPPRRSPISKRPKSPIVMVRSHSPSSGTPNKKRKTAHIIEIDDESDLDELPISSRKLPATSSIVNKPSTVKETTKALLAEFAEYSEDSGEDGSGLNEIRTNKTVPKRKVPPNKAPLKRKTMAISIETDNQDERGDSSSSSTERPTNTKRGNRLSEADKARRAAEKEETRLLRQREREAKAAEKEEAKQQKKREKEAKEAEKRAEQELLSVNKLKTSKKDSAQEMIVDISQHLKDGPIGDQLMRFLAGLGCEVNGAWYPVVGEGTWRVVKWRRKVRAEFDGEKSIFVPLPEMEVRDENHILVYITAKEFLDIAMGPSHRDGSGLAEHVLRLQKFSPLKVGDLKLLYLIEGLDTLVRKNKNNRNRQYQNRVRAQLGTGEERAMGAEIIDQDEIEDALLRLQIVHGCLIHHTQNAVETAEWICKFTGDISMIPYKKARMVTDTAFCTDVGQVKTGVGKADTYARMLEEINRVTPSVANGIASEYPDVQALVNGFREKGELALEHLPNIATRGGLPMSRNIGAACSRRVYSVFMGTDPSSTDV